MGLGLCFPIPLSQSPRHCSWLNSWAFKWIHYAIIVRFKTKNKFLILFSKFALTIYLSSQLGLYQLIRMLPLASVSCTVNSFISKCFGTLHVRCKSFELEWWKEENFYYVTWSLDRIFLLFQHINCLKRNDLSVKQNGWLWQVIFSLLYIVIFVNFSSHQLQWNWHIVIHCSDR